MRNIIILIILVAASCNTTGEQEHVHDAAGGHLTAENEVPAIDMTLWTDKTELFVEFPALTVGKISRFAAHFTILEGHKPVREGSVTVSLIMGNEGIRHTVDKPSSPGIFTPALQPKEAGTCKLVFDLQAPSLSERIEIDGVRVYDSMEAAINELGGEEENGAAITFLKEQAWRMEFQTVPVVRKEIFEIIRTSGIWKVAPSDFRTLVATADGRVTFNEGNLTEGKQVRRGETILTISSSDLTSNNLNAAIRKAKAELVQAKAAYERNKQLFESRIVPGSEFEQFEKKYEVARTDYEMLVSDFSAEGKQIQAPFDGFVKNISVENGGFVEQGADLFTITNQQSSLLETQLSPVNTARLNSIQDIWYQPRFGYWSSLRKSGGSILSVGKEVDPDNPLVTVYAKVNDVVEMPEGSFTEVQLVVGDPVETTVVPSSALLEDYGGFSVIVQLSGESYERRNVIPGKRNGDEVEIKQGLKQGEMVVSRGAYQVKMASMSGQVPAHGHTH